MWSSTVREGGMSASLCAKVEGVKEGDDENEEGMME